MFDSIKINFSCAMKNYHLNKFNKFYCRIVFSVQLPLLLHSCSDLTTVEKKKQQQQKTKLTHTNTYCVVGKRRKENKKK